MPYKIDASEVPNVMSMGVEDFSPRVKRDKGGAETPKLSPDNRPTYAAGVIAAREGGGLDRATSIAVIEIPAKPWPLGQVLQAQGACWLTPYVNDQNRLGLSFTVERLVPVAVGAAAGKHGEQ